MSEELFDKIQDLAGEENSGNIFNGVKEVRDKCSEEMKDFKSRIFKVLRDNKEVLSDKLKSAICNKKTSDKVASFKGELVDDLTENNAPNVKLSCVVVSGAVVENVPLFKEDCVDIPMEVSDVFADESLSYQIKLFLIDSILMDYQFEKLKNPTEEFSPNWSEIIDIVDVSSEQLENIKIVA